MLHALRTLSLIALTLITAAAAAGQDATPEATPGATPPTLTGVTWQWEHVADGVSDMTVESPDYTIDFLEDGRAGLRADCNIVLAQYRAGDDGRISIVPGPSTLVACPPGSLGDKFVRYLSAATVYSFTDDGELLLELPADGGTLTFGAQPQVTGTVTYRARMALPPDAVLRVQIEDVSIADAPSTVLGEYVATSEGAQVPLPFAVAYPASEFQPGRRYSLSARITGPDGRLLFISDRLIPVLQGDTPDTDVEIELVRVGG